MLFRLFSLAFVGLALASNTLTAQPAACIIETLAGGQDTPSGNGGPATLAELVPTDIAHGPDGALYIADFGHWSIRRVGLDGVITRVAGNGKAGYSPDGAPALEASIQPRYLAFDASGDLLFTDRGQVRKVTGGVIVTVAGNGLDAFSGDGGPAVEAGIGDLPRIAAEADGSFLVAQADHYRLRRVTPDGTIHTIAGSGSPAVAATGNGGPAIDAQIGSPRPLAVAPDGSIYFWGAVTGQQRAGVRRIRPDGIIEEHSPYFTAIQDLVVDTSGNLFAIHQARKVVRYDGAGWIDVVSVNAQSISAAPTGELLTSVWGDHQIVRVDDGSLTLVAGIGPGALHGDGGPASLANVSQATGISLSSDGSIYFVDRGLEYVRRITPGGLMEPFTTRDPSGLTMAGGLAAETYLGRPERVTVAPDGTVYISGVFFLPNIQLVAVGGNGIVSAIPTNLGPLGIDDIEADALGNLLLSYTQSAAKFLRVIGAAPTNFSVHSLATGEFAVGPNGQVFVGAGQGYWQSAALDGQPQAIPGLTGFNGESYPGAVAAGPDGSLYWATQTILWRMLPNLAIDQIAGRADAGYEGDNGPARDGQFTDIEEMTFGPDGHLYIADNDRIRRITSPHECPSAGPRPKIATFGVVNSADYRGLSPGAVFALFGAGLGPQEFVGAVLTQEGKLPTELGGTRVLFNGVPAPLLFSSAGQVNGIVPFGARVTAKYDGAFTFFPGDPVYAVVERNGTVSEQAGLAIYESWPGIFTRDSSGQGLAAAINQDDTVNSPDNPAAPGSVVVLWATGAGLTDLPQQDGAINSPPLAKPLLPITVEIGGVPVTVEFAGAAPGLVAGVIQINVRIPASFSQSGELPVVLKVGASPPQSGLTSPTIYVGQ